MAKRRERFGPRAKPGKWIPFEYPWDEAPIDLSFIYEAEKPAGKHGFLTICEGVFVFEDGTPAKFWGTNLNSAANFPSHEQAEKVAKRLAKFGVNIIRTHQMDGEWSAPNIFQFAKGRKLENTRSFDPESLDRFDYLMHCLKREGIYIYLDMLTYRLFREGDGVECAHALGNAAKPYSNFDPKLVELQKEYNRNLWTHVNPFTGLAYKDDPAVVLTEIANENDLLSNGGVELEPYRSRLEARFRDWAGRNGVGIGSGKVEFPRDPKKRTAAATRFLIEVQRDYYREMISHLREIGVKIPVAGSNWSWGPALLSALAAADFTDSHAYWGWFDKAMMTEAPWVFNGLASNRLLDRPFFVSEWDEPWPNANRAESPLMVAAEAALQGWGGAAIHTYRYRNSPADRLGGSVMGGQKYRVQFDAFNDPAKFGLFYHAALMFRRGDIREAERTAGIALGEREILGERGADRSDAALKANALVHRTGMVLPGQSPAMDITLAPSDGGKASERKKEITSDTGEIFLNRAKKYGWVDTGKTKAVYGCTGAVRELALRGLKIRVRTPFATLALSSLTDEPIAESANILLTAVGRADNTGARHKDNYPVNPGHAPITIEVIEAALEIATNRTGFKVWSIDAEGFQTGEVPAECGKGTLRFEIGKVYPSMYYLIQAV